MSTPNDVIVEMKADAQTCEDVDKSLVNSGIPVVVESRDPFRFRIPNNGNVLSILITVLEGRKVQAQGRIVAPSGRTFDISQEGLQTLKAVVAEAILRVQPTDMATLKPATSIWLAEIFKEALHDPEGTAKLVREVSSALRGDPQVLQQETKQVTNVTMTILTLMGAVIGLTAILSALGKVSGDATGFIFGAVLGSAFTFLQRYLTESTEVRD